VLVLEYGVREFLLVALKVGGINAEFMPRSRANLGTNTHIEAMGRRPFGYQREVFIRHIFEAENYRLVISGRIDGMIEQEGELLLEEIKSTFLPLEGLAPDNPFHLAQLRLYHYFESCRRPGTFIQPVLTYVHPTTLHERSFYMDWDIEESRRFFEDLAHALIRKEMARQQWLVLRDESIRALPFPFTELRRGQAELLDAVGKAVTAHHDLLVEAATGIGKTMGVLFPAIQHLSDACGYARILFLTAKTAGASVAQQAVAVLRARGLRLRVLYMQAKDRCCPFGADRPECSEDACPYAVDFYSRAEAIIPLLLEEEELTGEYLATAAREEMLCPFELSMELSLYADLIVCDYNYAFDPAVYLRQFFWPGTPPDSLLLVDEAHNLVARGREMYSAALDERELREIKTLFRREQGEFIACLEAALTQFDSWRQSLEFEEAGALRLPGLPGELLSCIEALMEFAGELLTALPRDDRRKRLLDCFFNLLKFSRIAAELTPEYAIYISAVRGDALRLRLFCLHPGPLLRQRVARSVATIFFSATLSPHRYFRELLGAREWCEHLTLPCPFPPENRLYLHVPDVSTRYRVREETKPSVAQVILDTAGVRRGNYLAFFPSFAYLGTVWAEMMVNRPAGVQIHVQKPGMSAAQQAEFLARVCAVDSEHSNLGLAVMGGLFGEAVDMPGEQLVGVIIVGPGLPPVGVEQELIGEYFEEEQEGKGFFYAYQVPGIIRVIQAAGRVFRTPTDRGVVLLIDDRFLQSPYCDLLPDDWGATDPDFSTLEYKARLEEFWAEERVY